MSQTMKKVQPTQIEKEINHIESQIGVESFQIELEETKLDKVCDCYNMSVTFDRILKNFLL
jgi:hypothetical protein